MQIQDIVLITIDLEVRVDNKVIIRTEKISPDQYIEDIELIGKALKKGKHNGVASIKAYDKKTGDVSWRSCSRYVNNI